MTFLQLKYMMADANFPLVHFSHHHGLLQYLSRVMVKRFMCGHSCVMTFLHLKVHNG